MKRLLGKCLASSSLRSPAVVISLVLFLAAPAFAQQGNSPWENAVNVLMTAFTSTIARGLSLVAIVVSGLTFAFAPLRPTSLIHSTSSSTSRGGPAAATYPKSWKSTDTIPTRTCLTTEQFFFPRGSRSEHHGRFQAQIC